MKSIIKPTCTIGLKNLLVLSLLWACAPLQTGPALRPLHAAFSLAGFEDLQAEYAGFRTLALTADYLERKIRTFLAENDGEAMRREIEFARVKHPQLLIDIMQASPELYSGAAFMPEVIAYRQQNALFDAYMLELSGSGGGSSGPFVPTQIFADGFIGTQAKLAMSGTGSFYVVENSGSDIRGLSYSSAGEPQRVLVDGEEENAYFQVNSTSAGTQSQPAIAMAEAGNFVVVWTSMTQDPDGSAGIYAQRFNAAGEPQGAEFRVNSTTTGDQTGPQVAMANNGNFVVAWTSNDQDGSQEGVYAQRFSGNGTPQGTEFQVNSHTENAQSSPTVAMSTGGNFVIAWASLDQAGPGTSGIYAQRYNSSGQPQGAEFSINSTTPGSLTGFQAAMDANGNFVVVWSRLRTFPDSSIYAQRFDAAGVAQGGEFQVNDAPSPPAIVLAPALAMEKNGHFAVSWVSNGPSTGLRFFLRHYDSAGTPASESLVQQSGLIYSGVANSIAMNAEGRFAMLWSALSIPF